MNVWLSMISGKWCKSNFLIKTINIGRPEHLLPPAPLRPITSHFCLTLHPPSKWTTYVYHPLLMIDWNKFINYPRWNMTLKYNKYSLSVTYNISKVSETDQTNEKQVEVNFEIVIWIFWLIIIWFCSKREKITTPDNI